MVPAERVVHWKRRNHCSVSYSTWWPDKGVLRAIVISDSFSYLPCQGDMHNREGLTLKRLWTAVCDYDLWPLYIAWVPFSTDLIFSCLTLSNSGLMFGIPVAPPETYLTLSLRNIGWVTSLHPLPTPDILKGSTLLKLICLRSHPKLGIWSRCSE